MKGPVRPELWLAPTRACEPLSSLTCFRDRPKLWLLNNHRSVFVGVVTFLAGWECPSRWLVDGLSRLRSLFVAEDKGIPVRDELVVAGGRDKEEKCQQGGGGPGT